MRRLVCLCDVFQIIRQKSYEMYRNRIKSYAISTLFLVAFFFPTRHRNVVPRKNFERIEFAAYKPIQRE